MRVTKEKKLRKLKDVLKKNRLKKGKKSKEKKRK